MCSFASFSTSNLKGLLNVTSRSWMRLVIPGGTYTGVVLQPSKDSRMASVF